MATLRDIGERELILRLSSLLGRRHDVLSAIGDDCAVVSTGPRATEDWLLTSDAVIENVHFMPDTEPERIGRKAAGRVLSDIAAMGGEPRWALVDLVAPPDADMARIEAVYRGMEERASTWNLSIVGGDTSTGNTIELHVFAVGTVAKGRAVMRSGARPGDCLFVTGSLGGSRAGHHLDFLPRMKEGGFLRDWASAMIDVSDGLATDLHHIAALSAVGIDVKTDAIPLSAEASMPADERTPVEHALYDGEDYELLFTVPARKREPFLTRWQKLFTTPLAEIGSVTEKAGSLRMQAPDGSITDVGSRGYEHFK